MDLGRFANLIIFALGIVLAMAAGRAQFGRPQRMIAVALLIALMVAVPVLTNTPTSIFDALTAMCIAYGWNFIGGYTGYAAFGNVAYVGLGAYVAAAFMSRQPGHPRWPWFVAMPLSVVITAAVAGLLGLAVLRLRGHYFSIATLGISVAMPQIVNWDFLFGPEGFAHTGLAKNFFNNGRPLNFPLAQDAAIGGLTIPADRAIYYLGLLTALVGLGVTAWLSRAKFGYSLVAIRENEEAAEVLGINTTLHKVLAYMLSAALAAFGGAMLGYRLVNMTTEPDGIFSTINNLQMIIICLIGGVGTIWGPWIGAFVLFGLQEILRTASGSQGFVQWQAVIFSCLIILVVLFLPRGLLHIVRNRARATTRPAASTG
jgi:branched-chain amino acid transport system permease protein